MPAFAAVLMAALLATAPASHTPPPPSTISTPGGLCLTATSTVPGMPVALTECSLGGAGQQWLFTPAGRFRLPGTGRYIAEGSGGLALGTWKQALVNVYVNHMIAADGMWWTWCSSSGTDQPWLQVAVEPGCQTWYVFTQVTAAGRTGPAAPA